ncbi:hypothetical protein AB0J14_38520 [Micromonospora arborensis]|uniref:hypothetical protein n=1 Tax=Micromonospora arborensis TaxID=2116518 RepID=UPI0033DEF7ED
MTQPTEYDRQAAIAERVTNDRHQTLAWDGEAGEPTTAELTHDVAIFAARWYAQPNDLIGGWCVMVTDQPPSAGGTMVADFTTRAIAEHMAELHNRTFEGGDVDSLPGVPA